MKIIFTYFKTFNKVIFFEKIPFLYTAILPVVLFIFTNYSWLTFQSPLEKILNASLPYVSYIVVGIALNGIALQIADFRERGSLKTYTMISGGNKSLVITGLSLSEFFLGLVCAILFSITLSFFSLSNIFYITLSVVLTYIISIIPVTLFLFFLDVLPIRSSTLGTIANLFFFLAVTISAMRRATDSIVIEFLYGLLPTDFVTQIGVILNNLILDKPIPSSWLLAALALLLLYSALGGLFLKKIRVSGVNNRN
ncbi:hypothetical protein BKP56_04570 [Marinilactibacillus sp. 15R]|uniref:hypothetical protein n=1 Tax=Marinilactibacillus sp. 15R TaxID=1911586 RepID=UPI00090A3AE6|nr:hypothetical protein [Marinilactibacillus sp. 15R]API88617.1 hypothetical protein BKP56_04570 [Marinilactibacillus sp. 15R]